MNTIFINKKYRKQLLLTFSILLFYNLQTALSGNRYFGNLIFSSNFHTGYILPHSSSIKYLTNGNFSGFSFTVNKQTSGDKEWHKIYNNPNMGFTFSRIPMGNTDVFGISNNLFYNINAPIYRRNKFALNYCLGIGLTYVDKHYDIATNYMNVAIGSAINYYALLGTETEISISKHISWVNGLNLNHFSNGSIHHPNLGINYFTFYSGIRYHVNTDIRHKKYSLPPKEKHEISYSVIYSVGNKRLETYDENTYFTTSLSATAEKQTGRKWKFGIGTDFFYNSSLAIEGKLLSHEKPIDYCSAGIHFSQTLVFNRTSIFIQEGFLIFLKDKVEERKIYNRFGIKYRIYDHLFLSSAVKSTLFAADFVEWGVGFKF